LIILDTNVISACMRPEKNKPVIAWLNAQPEEELWTTTVTLFELRYGIEKLTDEDRQAELDTAWREFGALIFGDRILTFDAKAARAAAELAGARSKIGRRVDSRDTFIAGVAISRGASIATRNVRDFFDAPVPVIDPWKAGAK
jgi:hypothetical protein